MSQSIILKGIYKNNKKCIYGIHNPVNNKTFTNEHLQSLKIKHDKWKTFLPKFKKSYIIMDLQNLNPKQYKFDYSEDNIKTCIKIAANDKFYSHNVESYLTLKEYQEYSKYN